MNTANLIIIAATPVADSFWEHASLWSIRLSLLSLVIALAMQLRGLRSVDRRVASIWFLGSLLALGHSIGSLLTFHHGSQADALASTAEQTRELLGFAFGVGLYVNYVFVLVWIIDASFRVIAPGRYGRLPAFYYWCVNCFLIFIAFNGAIVFKAGLVRWIGLGCCMVLGYLWLDRKLLFWGSVNRK
jgi:hypothetical protein